MDRGWIPAPAEESVAHDSPTGEWCDLPGRKVLVSMRDHALRRIVANALRKDGMEVVEAFDEAGALDEMRRRSNRRIEALLLDARRETQSVIAAIARARAVDPRLAIVALVVRCDDEFVAGATDAGAIVLRLPMTSRDLRATLDAAASLAAVAPRVDAPLSPAAADAA